MKILIFVICLLGLLLLSARLQRGSSASSQPHAARVDRMDVAEAKAVLGLEDTALDTQTVVAAHRRLMQHLHPDKGGSARLAQQLNEAKRVLLASLRPESQ